MQFPAELNWSNGTGIHCHQCRSMTNATREDRDKCYNNPKESSFCDGSNFTTCYQTLTSYQFRAYPNGNRIIYILQSLIRFKHVSFGRIWPRGLFCRIRSSDWLIVENSYLPKYRPYKQIIGVYRLEMSPRI